MSDEQLDPTVPIDFHHVSLVVSKVSRMYAGRNPHQNIKAIADVKIDHKKALELLGILAAQLATHEDGKGPITFSLEGEFAS
jgi:hypothetical protein